jgi:hypothetical protein
VVIQPTFSSVMGFSGAPETINGRLAMLGFVAAVGEELVDGRLCYETNELDIAAFTTARQQHPV